MKIGYLMAVSLGALLLTSCGDSSTTNPDGGTKGTYLITIQNSIFSPATLSVPAGATVTVRNLDGYAHSVTSESSNGSYTAGAASGVSFDTGVFSQGDKTFIIPSSAVVGSSLPYFCSIHTSMMGNGHITVASP